ncbi:hypothetical protein KAR91_78975 [Candidatus Pacearchaeota archaeon]|nr:hypothetical protein [Candidatus Pacearchaeota archaeon]
MHKTTLRAVKVLIQRDLVEINAAASDVLLNRKHTWELGIAYDYLDMAKECHISLGKLTVEEDNRL